MHVLCHGGARGSLFGLVLDADAADDAPVLLDPARLQQLVAPYAATLRLVVLAACDSGNQGAFGGLIGSTAQMLHRAGLAAVVASRYPLSVVGSEHLTATLYRGLLAEHRSLEQAFVAARTVLAGDTTRLDWASVQLYARAADGAASFLLAGPSSTPARPARAPRSRARVPAIAAAGVLTAVLGATWLATAPAEQPPPVDPTPPPIFDPKPSPESRDPTPPPAVPLKPVLKDVHPAPPLEPDPKSKAVKKKPEPPKPPEPPPESVECSSALRTFVHNVLPGSGTRVVTIVVKASRDGSMKVTGTDTPAIAAAREQLEVATPEQVKTYAAALPCHFTYKWKHPASP